MAMVLRLFLALGLALVASSEAKTNLRRGRGIDNDVSQDDIHQVDAEGTAGDRLDESEIDAGSDDDDDDADDDSDEEQPGTAMQGPTHDLRTTPTLELAGSGMAQASSAQDASVSTQDIERAEKTALNMTEDGKLEDEETKEMAEFDARHPDTSEKKEKEFEERVQKVMDETDGQDNEAEAELEMKVHEMKRNGGKSESVDDVKQKMLQEQEEAKERAQELKTFDNIFAGLGASAVEGSGVADKTAAHKDPPSVALVSSLTKLAQSGISSTSMFDSLNALADGIRADPEVEEREKHAIAKAALKHSAKVKLQKEVEQLNEYEEQSVEHGKKSQLRRTTPLKPNKPVEHVKPSSVKHVTLTTQAVPAAGVKGQKVTPAAAAAADIIGWHGVDATALQASLEKVVATAAAAEQKPADEDAVSKVEKKLAKTEGSFDKAITAKPSQEDTKESARRQVAPAQVDRMAADLASAFWNVNSKPKVEDKTPATTAASSNKAAVAEADTNVMVSKPADSSENDSEEVYGEDAASKIGAAADKFETEVVADESDSENFANDIYTHLNDVGPRMPTLAAESPSDNAIEQASDEVKSAVADDKEVQEAKRESAEVDDELRLAFVSKE